VLQLPNSGETPPPAHHTAVNKYGSVHLLHKVPCLRRHYTIHILWYRSIRKVEYIPFSKRNTTPQQRQKQKRKRNSAYTSKLTSALKKKNTCRQTTALVPGWSQSEDLVAYGPLQEPLNVPIFLYLEPVTPVAQGQFEIQR